MIQNMQIVYAKPPADGALPDPAGTFNVVHTPFDTEAMNLKAGEVLVENHYLSIDPYHRFGLYDPAVTRSQFPATKPGTIISTYGISRVMRSANPKYAVGDLLYSWVRWERFTVVDERISSTWRRPRQALTLSTISALSARLAWPDMQGSLKSQDPRAVRRSLSPPRRARLAWSRRSWRRNGA